jgi:hypothetical protein
MANYQFLKNSENNNLIHLDVDSPTFYQEKEQLFSQGFEAHGDTIQADTIEDAYSRANNIMLESVQQYGMAHAGGGLYYFVTGVIDLFKKKK